MPTAPSSTEPSLRALVWRPVADTGHLLAFRAGGVRRPRVVRMAVGGVAATTLAAAVVPAFVPGAGEQTGRSLDALVLMPSFFAGFLALTVVSAVASGGGRELLPRDQAAIHPISPTTDHLGALVLAPLNIAWLLQAWTLLGATAYAFGAGGLPVAQPVTLLWIAAATALAQVVAWSVEAVRRRPHGIAVVRTAGLMLAAIAVWLQVTDRFSDLLDRVPTRELVFATVGALEGPTPDWLVAVSVEVLLLVGAVVVGAAPAHLAARHAPRDEARVESGHHEARPTPGSDLMMLARVDRASVWRSVPMRRGLTVLAIGPGLIALAGGLSWQQVVVLPGLVVSGGALLFGVNSWCLDGRGVLWRESLPVRARTVFDSRALVLAEWLLAAALVTIVLASLRAGVPSGSEAAAVACTLAVVTLQVVAVALVWSGRRPFAVDLRSARATPAPPAVMVGYSAKLALTTTLTALVFSGLALLPWWWLSPVVAVPFLLWSGLRLARARRRWAEPVPRAAVVMTVAG